MRRLDSLKKLKDKGKIIIMEPSKNISESYLIKSANCNKVSLLAFNEELYENAITEAYYSSYNSVLALLYIVGIRSLSHIGTQIIIRDILELTEEYKILSELKNARIESQYYVKEEQSKTNERTKSYQIIQLSQGLNLNIKSIIINLKSKDTYKIRQKIIDI